MAALALASSGAAATKGRQDGGSLRDMRFTAQQLRGVMESLLRACTRESRLKLPGMQARPCFTSYQSSCCDCALTLVFMAFHLLQCRRVATLIARLELDCALLDLCLCGVMGCGVLMTLQRCVLTAGKTSECGGTGRSVVGRAVQRPRRQ